AVVLRVRDGAVPVMVNVVVPPGAAAVAVSVNVELPPAVTVAGLKLPLTPDGRPVIESVIVSAVPDVRCVVTVRVPLWPPDRVSVVGETDRLKSFGTVTCAVVLCVVEAAVP